jgi:site-specific recombinase XerD
MPDVITLPESENLAALPPVLSGANTPEIERRVENFFHSVASIFEAWVNRRKSEHTRRAYRGDVMAFVEFCKFVWPTDSAKLLRISILDVQAFKDHMGKHGGAPKTINSSLKNRVL